MSIEYAIVVITTTVETITLKLYHCINALRSKVNVPRRITDIKVMITAAVETIYIEALLLY